MKYRGAEASFDIPDNWEDKSIVAFSAPKPSRGSMAISDDGAKAPSTEGRLVPNVVLTKDRRASGEPFPRYVERICELMAAELPEFELRMRRTREIGVELHIAWVGATGRFIHQRILMTPGDDDLIVALNVTFDGDDEDALTTTVDRILASFEVTPTLFA